MTSWDRLDLRRINEPSIERYESKIKTYLETGRLDSLEKNLYIGDSDDNSEVDFETGLVDTSSTQFLENIREDMGEKRNNAEIYARSTTRHCSIKRKEFDKMIRFEMSKFDLVKSELDRSIMIMNVKINKIQKLIATIEVYAGIEEEVIQIQEGTPAPVEDMISLRQQMLLWMKKLQSSMKIH